MQKKLISCLLVLICVFTLLGNTEIDSLEMVLKKSAERDKSELLNELSIQYISSDLEMSLECALQAKEIAKKYEQNKEEAKANYNLGIYYRKKGDFTTSLSLFEESLELYKKIGDEKEIAKGFKALGNVYNYQGNFNNALDSYYKALGIFISLKEDFHVALLYNNIGICYNRLGDYHSALENYYLSLHLKQEIVEKGEMDEQIIRVYSTLNNIGNLHLRLKEFDKALENFLQGLDCCNDEISTSKLLNNIGIAYQEKRDLEKALFYFERALSINKKLNRKDKIAVTWNNIGYVYDLKKDWPSALTFYQKALIYKQEVEDQFGIANCQKNVGSIFLEMKQYDKAREYFLKSIEIAEEIGAMEIVKDDNKYLSRIYLELKSYKTALEYEHKYSAISNSLFHESMAEQLAAIETNYEVQKAEKENEILLKNNLLFQFESQKANFAKLRSYLLILILLFITAIIAFGYLQKKERTKILQKSKHNLEIQVSNRTTELGKANADLLIENEERKKAEIIIKESLKEKEVMLREIHHRVKNNLQIISSILNLQSNDELDNKTLTALENTRDRIYSMSLIHEKLYMENNLAQIDFKDYISGLLNYLMGNYQHDSQRIDLKLDVQKTFLKLDTAIPCGLMINEIITNSIKYAFKNIKQGLIEVKMFKDKENYFNLVIGDNGDLIKSQDELVNQKSIGMKLIRLLSRQIRSEMKIDVSNGVKYSFKFKEK